MYRVLAALVIAVVLSGALCQQSVAGSKSSKNGSASKSSSKSSSKAQSRLCSLWVVNVHKNGNCWTAGPFPTSSKACQAANWIRCTYQADVSEPYHPCCNDNNDDVE